MRRLILALSSTLALLVANVPGANADLVSIAATITCADGHSVVMWVDQSGLLNLTSEIQAINASGTTSCTLASTSSTETTEWTVYDYNPSNHAIAPRNSPNAMPATTTGATTTFQFLAGIYTALLTTTDPTLTGNVSGRTLTDTVSVSGSALTFTSQNGDGCNVPANVRFYFVSPSASGSSVGTPSAGFYTQFWWSNPVNVPLLTGNQPSQTIQAHMANPAEWSDWNGQNGANPLVTEAFLEATQKVQTIGLSFGGGCFFENGVSAVNPPEAFSSTFSEQ